MSECHPLPPWRRTLAVFCLLQATVFLFFFPGLFGGYTYDSNNVIQSGGPSSPVYTIGSIFSPERHSSEVQVMSWRPLSSLSFLIIDKWTLGNDPFWSHLVDFLLHGINATLVFVCLVLMTRLNERLCVALALLFALHPLATEVVLCTGFRFDLLALSFILLSCIAAHSIRNEALCISIYTLFVLLSLASKEIGIVASIMPPLSIYLYGNRARGIRLGIASVVATVAFAIVWIQFKYADYPSDYLGGAGRIIGIANFLVVFFEIYLKGLFFPLVLRIDHEFRPITTLLDGRLILAVTVLFGLAAGLALRIVKDPEKRPLIFMAFAWVVVSFAPVAQLVPVPDPVAERFCYVPLVGFIFLLAGVLPRAARERETAAVLALIIVLCAIRTNLRAYDWRDDLTLNIANWQDSPSRTEKSARSLAALYLSIPPGYSSSRISDTQVRELINIELEAIFQQLPADPEPWRLRAIWRLQRGDRAGALEDLDAAKERGLSTELESPLRRILSP
ncbi:hypothetical protein GC173_01620 [bacterium]|nr:hypothetical protein [bacterium]